MDFLATVLPDLETEAILSVRKALERKLSTLSSVSGRFLYDAKQLGDQLSVQEWDFAAKRFTIVLKHLGLKHGGKVYILASRNMYTYAVSLAAWRLGGVVVLGCDLDDKDNAADLRSELNETQPVIIVSEPEMLPKLMDQMWDNRNFTFRKSRILCFNGAQTDSNSVTSDDVMSSNNSSKICHNIFRLARDINTEFMPEITNRNSNLPMLIHKGSKAVGLKVLFEIMKDNMSDSVLSDNAANGVTEKALMLSARLNNIDGFLCGLCALLQNYTVHSVSIDDEAIDEFVGKVQEVEPSVLVVSGDAEYQALKKADFGRWLKTKTRQQQPSEEDSAVAKTLESIIILDEHMDSLKNHDESPRLQPFSVSDQTSTGFTDITVGWHVVLGSSVGS